MLIYRSKSNMKKICDEMELEFTNRLIISNLSELKKIKEHLGFQDYLKMEDAIESGMEITLVC